MTFLIYNSCAILLVAALCATPCAALAQWRPEDLRPISIKSVLDVFSIESTARMFAVSQAPQVECDAVSTKYRNDIVLAAHFAKRSSDVYAHDYVSSTSLFRHGEYHATDTDGKPVVIYTKLDAPSSRDFLAEVYESSDTVEIIFRGTNISSISDVEADLRQVIGQNTSYHIWASTLVRMLKHKFPEKQIILAGHSLGGGLAMFAAMVHGVSAYLFNPAGISQQVLKLVHAPHAYEFAYATQIRTFISDADGRMDLLSALSLSGYTAIVGQKYLVPVTIIDNSWLQLHSIDALRSSLNAQLNSLSKTPASFIWNCSNDLGLQPSEIRTTVPKQH